MDNALNGRSQAGTSPRPTADKDAVTSFKDFLGAILSTMGKLLSQPE
ncbi:hypothetical protein WFZ85_07290 [Flavobacterium sp. j3]|uniref:Uncharacterized protein n=1 Tax=Flavobacterium aureirubrum TaxID=3133147 RepID=A0ABU9N3W8_9FLAO